MDKKEVIFNLYKDEPIGIKKFRPILIKKYRLSDRDITDLYAKINNYQVKRYGARLTKGNSIEYNTKEELERRRKILKAIKKQKLNNYENQKRRYKEMKEDV